MNPESPLRSAYLQHFSKKTFITFIFFTLQVSELARLRVSELARLRVHETLNLG